MATATITEYADGYQVWYGLKDGTLLETTDERGQLWSKHDNDTQPLLRWKED